MMIILAWILSTILWLGIWIPFYIIGYLFIWVGLLFCNRNSEHMPFLWWPWDNNHGINGTLDYNNLNWVGICNPAAFISVTSIAKKIKIAKEIVDSKLGAERTYGRRYEWCAFRNPVTNISLFVIGVKINKEVKEKTYNWGPFIFGKVTCGWLWTYSFTLKYNDTRGFFYSFGWKFTDPSLGRARFLYRISPYKSLE